MAKIPTTNIGMNLLKNEYGGNNPIRMSDYYRKTANNGNVDNSYTTAGGYLTPVRVPYVSGINSSSNQKSGYRKQTYVNRYSNNPLYGADAGQPIGNPWVSGEPRPLMLRIWIWNGTTVFTETPRNDDRSNGPGTNRDTGWIGSYGTTRTYYYTPNAYVYASNGQLQQPGYGGCQNPSPSNIQNQTYPYSSVGPNTGAQYGPLTGLYGFYAMQSQVFYGIRQEVQDWTPQGTAYSNQTVPTSGTISLGDFKNQENLP